MRPGRLAVTTGAFLLALLCAGTVLAQRWGRVAEGYGVPVQHMPATYSDGTFAACKLMYRSNRSEYLGMGWATDYPVAAMNLMTRVSELTKTPISKNDEGEPNHFVVSATDPALFRCPYLLASDVGTLHFSDVEVARMRAYLLKGGFLWVDDFWGTASWQQWTHEIKRVMPEYQIIDIPLEHPIRHTLYDLQTIPQVTAIQNWRRTHDTRERGDDSTAEREVENGA